MWYCQKSKASQHCLACIHRDFQTLLLAFFINTSASNLFQKIKPFVVFHHNQRGNLSTNTKATNRIKLQQTYLTFSNTTFKRWKILFKNWKRHNRVITFVESLHTLDYRLQLLLALTAQPWTQKLAPNSQHAMLDCNEWSMQDSISKVIVIRDCDVHQNGWLGRNL